MTAKEHLEIYLEGWRLGNGSHSLPAMVPGFYYDDPNTGRINRDGFVQFVEDFKSAAMELNNGKLGKPFLTYSDTVIDTSSSPHTAWCWWQATDTDLQGSAMIKFDDTGVLCERIAYFSKLPE